jgi:hypothetical protein
MTESVDRMDLTDARWPSVDLRAPNHPLAVYVRQLAEVFAGYGRLPPPVRVGERPSAVELMWSTGTKATLARSEGFPVLWVDTRWDRYSELSSTVEAFHSALEVAADCVARGRTWVTRYEREVLL